MTRKYPLDPLKRVRAEKVDQQTRSLSQALRTAEAAGAEVERRARAKERLEGALAGTARGERERLERGELTSADLARGAAWGVSADLQRQQMSRSVDEARKEQTRALSAAEQERASLTVAQAESKVVEKHHEKWRAAGDAAREAREEENAEEAYLGRPKGGANR